MKGLVLLIGAVVVALSLTYGLGIASASSSSASGGTKVAVAASSALGRILVDGHGRTLYLFAKDKHGKSALGPRRAVHRPPLIAVASCSRARARRRRCSARPAAPTAVGRSPIAITRSTGTRPTRRRARPPVRASTPRAACGGARPAGNKIVKTAGSGSGGHPGGRPAPGVAAQGPSDSCGRPQPKREECDHERAGW